MCSSDLLERGRKECYISLRRQLLALALGQCTVVTQTYRDGDFRKCTERQLPPNLRAIRYWLDNMSAQRDSNSSECGESEKSGKREKQEKWKSGTNENDSAQRLSNSSECGRAGKGDGKNGSNEKNGDKTERTDDMPAKRLSNSSESGGCPSCNAGRMGETSSAQRDSISSEWGRAGKGDGKNVSNENNVDKAEKTDHTPAQRPSISSESGKGDGNNGSNENNGDKTEKTENTPAQRLSISSESAVSPLRPLCPFRP